LKQDRRAWYDRLKKFFLEKGFSMGNVVKTLFVLKQGNDQLFIQIYVDDIIFGGSSHVLVSQFSEITCKEFEMSMMGELTFFLGLQIKQAKEGMFVHQGKYTKDLLYHFGMENSEPIVTPMGATSPLDLDEDQVVKTWGHSSYEIVLRSLSFLVYSSSSSIFEKQKKG
jgi:hypothetical protein